MAWLRNHALAVVRVSVLVALTLVPLALSGHFHANPEGSSSSTCALCVATHHAPAAQIALLPWTAPILGTVQLQTATFRAPGWVFQLYTPGRAPPSPPLLA